MATRKPPSSAPVESIIIKKYANRRLYDTAHSVYVTLVDLANMAREGREFIVQDAKTGEDLTRQVLAQIVLESESSGESLLPLSFLRQIAGLYGDALRMAVPSYLDLSMNMFRDHQEAIRERVEATMGASSRTGGLEKIAEANREFFENTMGRTLRALNPFGVGPGGPGDTGGRRPPPAGSSEIAELREQITAMQGKLEELADRRD